MNGLRPVGACGCARLTGNGQHDIVIVGGGAMGLLAARVLADRGRAVTLVESGGERPARDAGDALNVMAPPALKLDSALGSGLGGTGRWWGGQCVTPPAGDFDAEPARGSVSWPISHEELAPWVDKALNVAGLTNETEVAARDRVRSRLVNDVPGFHPWPTVYMPRYRLDRQWRRDVESHPRARVVTDIRVLSISPRSDTLSVTGTCGAGHVVTFSARGIVLCAGAIANAQVLLQSTSGGLSVGTSCGRYLSEHLTVHVAVVRNAPLARVVSSLGTGFIGNRRFWPKLVLQKETRLAARLPAVAADLVVEYSTDIAEARRDLSGRQFGGTQLSPRRLPSAGRAIVGLGLARLRGSAVDIPAVERLIVQLNVEQPPRVENGLLREPRDGVHGSRITWDIDNNDLRAIRSAVRLLVEAWPTSLGELRILEHVKDDVSLRTAIQPAFHHSGTTRMGTSVLQSVVDAGQRLHGDPRVLVLGGSVFPTASWMNPTLLAWATSLRALATWP